jgi:uncharacterized membrane protein HdeD (DUF308 family)
MGPVNNRRRLTVGIFRKHIIYPLTLTAIFFVNAFTPVSVLGCQTRGLAALAIALTCGLSSLLAAIAGIRSKVRKDTNAGWWIVSSIILLIPVAALIILA